MSKYALSALLISALGLSPGSVLQEPRWTATPAARAGAQDGPGALTEVFDMEIGPNGELLAGQPSAGTIAVFAADGRYLRSFGRRGQGPGEFQVVGRMGWIGDTLWVVDFGRLQLFNSSFHFARSITFPTLKPPAGVSRMIPGPILADGSVLGIPVIVDSGRLAPIVRLSKLGDIIDTLAHVLIRDGYTRIPVPGSPRAGNVLQSWMEDPIWVSTPDGQSVAIVNRPIPSRAGAGSFEIMRIGLDGDTVVHRVVEFVPLERTRAEADEWYASTARRLAAQLSVPEAQAERAIRRVVQLPRYHLPVTRMVVGRDETIWLRREDTGGHTVDWQVFDRSGRVLGRLSLPSAFMAHRAQAGRVWGVEKDSLDISFLRVYEIR